MDAQKPAPSWRAFSMPGLRLYLASRGGDNPDLERTHLVADTSVHSGRTADPPQIRGRLDRIRASVWRIPLDNAGGDATNTHVELTSIDRAIPEGRWPGPAHLAGENPDDQGSESYTRSRVPCSRGGHAGIDVVSRSRRCDPIGASFFAVESSDALIEVTLGSAQAFR